MQLFKQIYRMRAIRFIMCVVVGMMLMLGVNSCVNKNNVKDDSSSQPEMNEKKQSDSNRSGVAGKLVLLDFYATWCPPCKQMIPVMEKMEEKYGDRIVFKRIDVNENEELANKYSVQSIPNIVILSPEDEILENFVGYRDANQMDVILNDVLKK